MPFILDDDFCCVADPFLELRPRLRVTMRRSGCRVGKHATHNPTCPSRSVQTEVLIRVKGVSIAKLVVTMTIQTMWLAHQKRVLGGEGDTYCLDEQLL